MVVEQEKDAEVKFVSQCWSCVECSFFSGKSCVNISFCLLLWIQALLCKSSANTNTAKTERESSKQHACLASTAYVT